MPPAEANREIVAGLAILLFLRKLKTAALKTNATIFFAPLRLCERLFVLTIEENQESRREKLAKREEQ